MKGPARKGTEALRSGAAGLAAWTLVSGCGKSHGAAPDAGDGTGVVSAPNATAPGTPRRGMAWIPAGVLRAGSDASDVPRVADAELPGVDVPLGGFYIDLLPWPNEAGAIPTTNLTRDEARRLCEGKGKRLCSELEWERACKGPDNGRYEYGATYDARACGAGIPAETACRRPSGGKLACHSLFGVRDMHGGAWEWTDSRWGRGALRDLGVVRGGSDVAGELTSRCSFARQAPPDERSPTTAFRCCAGPRNDAEVELDVKWGPPFERTGRGAGPSPPLDALAGVACGPPGSPGPCSVSRAWTWRPAPNVELFLAGGCVGRDPQARCAIALSQRLGDHANTLAQIDTGIQIPEVVLVEGPERRVRVRGANLHGQFFREIVFNYGRVDVKEVR